MLTLTGNAQNLDEVDMTECREVSWMTEKCKITASNIGLWWSKLEQEGDINCVDVYTDSNLIVMGDSCGNVCLYRYPCDRKGVNVFIYIKGPVWLKSELIYLLSIYYPS